MGSPGWTFILLQLWGLQGAVSLSVQQWPPCVNVTQGGEMSLFCGVKQSQSWERLRVEWARNNVVFCHLLISNGSLNPEDCEFRGQLSWWPPANFSLRLDHVSLNDSGDYVCRATLEIPKLQKAKGNGTKVKVKEGGLQLKETSHPSGLLLALLVAGGVVAALVVLGAVLWGLSRCRREDSGESACPENSFYSNVLYRPRESPRRLQDLPKEKDTAREQRAQASISPPSPSLPRASSFLSTNPAPGPGPATPSLPTVSLSRAPGGRDRPHAKRDPGSRKRLWRPLRTQNGPGQELCEGVAVSIRRGGVRQLQAEINDMTQGLLIKAPLDTVYGAQDLNNSTCDLLLNHTPSLLGILGGAPP
ncbi:transmembrane and immunoglobulin domain-containing protein 2 [Peromyscus leucopus]|uniref:transmembrane and immunoglobulin domain-containing protein 2 n=1 Tax=Peromyscus leucopus TaxID=10041 RepID=UPI001885119D|nr:transmembrane and immunoglobulin domain-containing protein 2 [Peromyscus leucopus]